LRFQKWSTAKGATGPEVSFYNNIIYVISWLINTELKQIYCICSHFCYYF